MKELLELFIVNPSILHKVGKNALNTASFRPWSHYEQELAISVETFINEHFL